MWGFYTLVINLTRENKIIHQYSEIPHSTQTHSCLFVSAGELHSWGDGTTLSAPPNAPRHGAPAGSTAGPPGYVQLYFNRDLNGTFPLPTSPPACFISRCVAHHPHSCWEQRPGAMSYRVSEFLPYEFWFFQPHPFLCHPPLGFLHFFCRNEVTRPGTLSLNPLWMCYLENTFVVMCVYI